MNKDGWVIYGYSWCPYSKRAINLLKSKNIQYLFVDVNIHNLKKIHLKKLNNSKKLTLHNTFPFIFHHQTFIGGYDDLKIYLSN